MQISFMPIKHRMYIFIAIAIIVALIIALISIEIALDILDIVTILPAVVLAIVAYYLYDSFYCISACQIVLSSEKVVCMGRKKRIELSWSNIAEVGIAYSTYGDRYRDVAPAHVLQNQYLYLSRKAMDETQRKKVAASFRKKGNSTVIAISVDGQQSEIDEALAFIRNYYSGEIIISPK